MYPKVRRISGAISAHDNLQDDRLGNPGMERFTEAVVSQIFTEECEGGRQSDTSP